MAVTRYRDTTELLSNVDRDIVDILLRQMRHRLRIQLHLGNEVAALIPHQSAVRLQLSHGREIQVEKVLYAAGRQSNTADLDLAHVGVQTGTRGVLLVNEHYQTNVPHIYAAGDVIGFPALASTSMEQARVAMVHAFNLQYETKLAALLPYGIYTIPEVAMVGQTEEDCLKAGRAYEVGRAYYRNTARGQIIGDTAGMLKLVFDPVERHLLGMHIIGDEATELIHVGMMVMQLGGTLDTFVQSVFNYPTLGDIYKHAAEDGLGRLVRRQHQRALELAEAEASAQQGRERPPSSQADRDATSGEVAEQAMVQTEAMAVRADAPAPASSVGSGPMPSWN